MPFKKLIPSILDTLSALGCEEPTTLQEKAISKIKSGTNIFVTGPKDSGKTTTLIINTIQQLKGRAIGDNPRALIFVKDRNAAKYLEERFSAFINKTDLRMFCVFEEGDVEHQKDAIYIGMDIVIATPKRLSKLYFLNGVNLTQLQMIVVEDAEFLVGKSFHTDIDRISESVKCQHVVFAEKYDDKLNRLKELFMEVSQVVSVK